MKILSWNVRGLNSRGKQCHLMDEISKENPTIIILQETKLTRDKMSKIARSCWKGCEMMSIEEKGNA